MKKQSALIAFLILLSFSAASLIATYPGRMEKQGPEAEFVVGYASDNEARLELEANRPEGINITLQRNYSFNPDEEERSIQRGSQNIPLKQFQIQVESVNPVREVYEIPVTLTAYSGSNQEGSTTPRVVQEREYEFTYYTESSEGFEGDLINSNPPQNNQSEEIPDQSPAEGENTSTNQKQNKLRNQNENDDEGATTLILAVLVLMVFSYTIYEAVA